MDDFKFLSNIKTIDEKLINAYPTDFARVLGCLTDNKHYAYYFLDEINSYANPLVFANNKIISVNRASKDIGIRLVMPSNISNYIVNNTAVNEFNLGYYPKSYFNEDVDLSYLKETGNTYTISNSSINNCYDNFRPLTLKEYDYKGKRLVKIKVKTPSFYNNQSNIITLPNNKILKNNDEVWIEVLPIIWIIDKNSKQVITKDVILSGIEYSKYEKKNNNIHYLLDDNCLVSVAKNFINTIFKDEIFNISKFSNILPINDLITTLEYLINNELIANMDVVELIDYLKNEKIRVRK